jgi:hypothetical protein
MTSITAYITRRYFATAALVAGAITLASPVSAQALHGFCAGTGQCIDNGTNSPTSTNPPADFGFTISGGQTPGDLWLAILVPNNEQTVTSYTLTGPGATTATEVSGEWTSKFLDAFLGLSASPANPIGACLPSTQALDPGATGFSVYVDNVGTRTLLSPSNPNVSPLYNISSGIPLGSYIVGFLNTSSGFVATANSGAIFETTGLTSPPPPPPVIPEPSTWAMMLLGFAGLGYAGFRTRRPAVGAAF